MPMQDTPIGARLSGLLRVLYGPLLFIALALGGKMVNAEPIAEKIAALLPKEWSKVAQPLPSSTGPSFWKFLLSPPLPCTWPASGSGKICYYAYAYAMDPSLADGVRVAAPWAKVSLDSPFHPEAAKVETLGKQLQILGIQGVRPLAGGELEIAKSGDQAKQMLLNWVSEQTPLSQEERAGIVAYYCQWTKTNGVIAAAINPLHADFFAWLGCK